MGITYKDGRLHDVTVTILTNARALYRNPPNSRYVTVDIPQGVYRSTLRTAIYRAAESHGIYLTFTPKKLTPDGKLVFRFESIPDFLIQEWEGNAPKKPKTFRTGSKCEWYDVRLVALTRKGDRMRVPLHPTDNIRMARSNIATVCKIRDVSFKTIITDDGKLLFKRLS